MKRSLRIPLLLTIVAMAPFAGLSMLVSFRVVEEIRPIAQALVTYAGIVLSFLGGIHWGLGINLYPKRWRMANLLIVESVAPAVIAWSLPMLHDIHMQILALTLLYAFVWCIDSLLYERDVIPQWFFNIRCVITPIAMVSLYVAYFGLV